MLSEDNIKTVISYVMSIRTEINFSTNYRKNIIEMPLFLLFLVSLQMIVYLLTVYYHKNKKPELF